jgi:hypothetical protein
VLRRAEQIALNPQLLRGLRTLLLVDPVRD